jgi:hypothetical protein
MLRIGELEGESEFPTPAGFGFVMKDVLDATPLFLQRGERSKARKPYREPREPRAFSSPLPPGPPFDQEAFSRRHAVDLLTPWAAE